MLVIGKNFRHRLNVPHVRYRPRIAVEKQFFTCFDCTNAIGKQITIWVKQVSSANTLELNVIGRSCPWRVWLRWDNGYRVRTASRLEIILDRDSISWDLQLANCLIKSNIELQWRIHWQNWLPNNACLHYALQIVFLIEWINFCKDSTI